MTPTSACPCLVGSVLSGAEGKVQPWEAADQADTEDTAPAVDRDIPVEEIYRCSLIHREGRGRSELPSVLESLLS